ncbi:MAG TPA: YvcK family protein [Candidatus Saccharimonadales bacterium]|nr:YvcK family protein [Candidatus Saccharimonadales bacterium]
MSSATASSLPAGLERTTPAAGLNVVCVGGGTGLATLLSGLKAFVRRPAEPPGVGRSEPGTIGRLTAIVTVSDDGGSSGRLREEFQVLPPGDIRNCIAALSEESSVLLKLFNYRFGGNGTLGGHSFGNLLLTALSSVTGDFVHAVRLVGEVLAIRGTIYPSTCENVRLMAELEDGSIVRGESRISQSHVRIRSLRLEPERCPALPETLDAIAAADLIVLGPGSLYTSIVPNLLVDGVAGALRESRAHKVLVCNLMTQTGETRGFSASDHAQALRGIAGEGLFDTALVNSRVPPTALIDKYRLEGAEVVTCDPEGFEGMPVRVVSRDLMSATDLVRHEPEILAREVLALVRP